MATVGASASATPRPAQQGNLWGMLGSYLPTVLSDVIASPWAQGLLGGGGSILDKVSDIAGVTGGSVGGAVDEALKKVDPMQYLIGSSAAMGPRDRAGIPDLVKGYKLHEPLSQIKGADYSRASNAILSDADRMRSSLAGLNIGQQQGDIYGNMQQDIRRGMGFGGGPSAAYAAAGAAGNQMGQASRSIYNDMAKQVTGNIGAAAGLTLANTDAGIKNAADRYARLTDPYKIAHDASVANSVAGATASAAGQSAGTTAAGVAQTRLLDNPLGEATMAQLGQQGGAQNIWNLMSTIFG